MKLDCLSFVPFDRDAIDINLLEQFELDWLNNYQTEVFETLSSYLSNEEKKWLKVEH